MYFFLGSPPRRVDFNSSATWTEESVYHRMKGHLNVHAVGLDLDNCAGRIYIRSPEDLWFASRIVAAYLENCHSESEIMSRNESLDDREHTNLIEAEVALLWRNSDSDADSESETE